MTLTRHGHHIPGTGYSRNEQALADPSPCGGPDMCAVCALDCWSVKTKLQALNIPLDEENGTDMEFGTATAVPPRPVNTPESYLEGTNRKVYDALVESGLTRDQALESMRVMQNAGILFRERFKL